MADRLAPLPRRAVRKEVHPDEAHDEKDAVRVFGPVNAARTGRVHPGMRAIDTWKPTDPQ